MSPHRSQPITNEACIAQVIRTASPARPGYSNHLVRMLVSIQLDDAMGIITAETLGGDL